MFRHLLITIFSCLILAPVIASNPSNFSTSAEVTAGEKQTTYCGVTTYQIADYVRAQGYEPISVSPYGECDALVRTNGVESLHIFIQGSTIVGFEALDN